MTLAVEYVFIYIIEYPVRFVKNKRIPDGIYSLVRALKRVSHFV